MEFTFTARRYLLPEEMHTQGNKQMNGLGFHVPGMFSKVLEIDTCYLQDEMSNQIRNFVRNYTIENNYPYYDIRKQTGVMRNLVIRNTTLGEWMVVVVFAQDVPSMRDALLEAIARQFPAITSIQYVINTKGNDTIYDLEPIVYRGAPGITEQMEKLKFAIGPKSFFQTNSKQALALYQLTRELAGLTGTETVYDLYTGTGTIALFVAAQAKKVVGVESVPEAIEDARINASSNHILNVVFFAGDMKNVLNEEFFRTHGSPDVIITDPPRAGMHESVVRRILESGARRVVYVSCNPATQARDIKLMSELYEMTYCQPVDMFPHTSHVENVIRLERKNR
jgi:23S rRNA (uracil1939-C5)-methyltransferase